MESTGVWKSGVVVLLCVILEAGGAAQESPGLAGADRLYAQADYRGALRAYQAILRLRPQAVAACCGAGKCLIALGRIQDAMTLLQKAVGFPDATAEAHSVLGQTCFWGAENLRRNAKPWDSQAPLAGALFADAEAALNRAIEMDARLPLAHFFLGKVKMAQNRPVKAATAFCNALEIDANNTSFHFELARALERSRKHAAAAEAFRAAAAHAPEGFESYARKARVHAAACLARAGDMPRATEAFKREFLANPKDIALFRMAWRIFGTDRKRHDEGIRLLEELACALPTAAMPGYFLGHLQLARGRKSEARRTFEKVLKTEEGQGYSAVWAYLGETYFVDDRALDPAERCLLKALELDPANKRAYTVLTYLVSYWLRRQRDMDRAIDLTRKILKVQPDNADEWSKLATLTYNRALFGRSLGESPEALRHFARAEKIAPDDPLVQCGLGKVYNAIKRYDKAEAHFKAALALDPDHLETLWDYGYMCKDTGQFAKARALWERLLSFDPGPGRPGDPVWSRYRRTAGDLERVTRELEKK